MAKPSVDYLAMLKSLRRHGVDFVVVGGVCAEGRKGVRYLFFHQEGSHTVLETSEPAHQRLAVPAHKNLRVGSLNAILRAVGKHKGVERQAVLESL